VCTGTILGRTRLVLNDIGEVLREVDDDTEKRLVCPWHGWEYDITTGELAHDRRYHLRRHEVLVEDGVVYVEA
jgi:nitrite reductase/ring-hydroxylating ferredoxin subunit